MSWQWNIEIHRGKYECKQGVERTSSEEHTTVAVSGKLYKRIIEIFYCVDKKESKGTQGFAQLEGGSTNGNNIATACERVRQAIKLKLIFEGWWGYV